MTSASAGVSLRVESKNWLARMIVRLREQRLQLYGETAMFGSELERSLYAVENTKKTVVFMHLKKKTPCSTVYSRVESAELHS